MEEKGCDMVTVVGPAAITSRTNLLSSEWVEDPWVLRPFPAEVVPRSFPPRSLARRRSTGPQQAEHCGRALAARLCHLLYGNQTNWSRRAHGYRADDCDDIGEHLTLALPKKPHVRARLLGPLGLCVDKIHPSPSLLVP